MPSESPDWSSPSVRPSANGHQLQRGMVYTRAQLKDIFEIKDATINNGVFRVRDRHEVWLFVTERKQPDRVQYQDQLVGDELHWQGQALGRTDHLIISHKADGNDILVFYRKARDQYPASGFRLEGHFDYVSHSGSTPANFILKRS